MPVSGVEPEPLLLEPAQIPVIGSTLLVQCAHPFRGTVHNHSGSAGLASPVLQHARALNWADGSGRSGLLSIPTFHTPALNDHLHIGPVFPNSHRVGRLK